MERVQKLKSSNTAPSSKTFRDDLSTKHAGHTFQLFEDLAVSYKKSEEIKLKLYQPSYRGTKIVENGIKYKCLK
jgi:hypothetical protein